MKIERVDTKEEFTSKFVVSLERKTFEDSYEQQIKQIAPNVKMDGFREGNVPLEIIRQKHGERIRNEVLALFSQEAMRKILTENKDVRPIVSPRVVFNLEQKDTIVFDVDIDTAPEVKIRDFTNMKIERSVVKIEGGEVQKYLQDQARRTAAVVAIDRASRQGDVVVIDYKGKIGAEKTPSLNQNDYRLGLGDGLIHEDFEKNMESRKVGDKLEFSFSFPKDYKFTNVAGKLVAFSVSVKQVLERKAEDMEVNEALAKRLNFSSLDALEERARQRIRNNFAGTVRQLLKRQIFDWFDKEYDFPLPQRLLDSEFETIWKQLREKAEKQEEGKSQDEKSEAQWIEAEKELRKQYQTIAHRRLKTGLLVFEIGQQNNIVIDDSEIIRQIKAQIGNQPNEQQKKLLQELDSNPRRVLAQVKPGMFEEKVVDFVLSQITVVNKEVSSQDLSRQMREMQKDSELNFDGTKSKKTKKSARSTKKESRS